MGSSVRNGHRRKPAAPELGQAPGAPAALEAGSARQRAAIRLQRTIGNRATRTILQPKLMVGPADDRYEREADRIADAVMRASGPVRRRRRRDHSIGSVRRAAIVGAEGGVLDTQTESAIRSAGGGGAPLQPAVRAEMEPALGVDLSAVRIHTGPGSDRLNEALQSRAFTAGADIFVRRSDYLPQSHDGRRLLAHELVHVVQQGSGSIRRAWDLDQPNWNSTTNIRPLDDRGTALLFSAGTDRMVVKASETPPALERMVAGVYEHVGGFNVARGRDVTNDLAAIQAQIALPAKSVGPGWDGVAALLMNDATNIAGARAHLAANFGTDAARPYIQTAPWAQGTETEQLATGQGPQGQRFRNAFRTFPYMVQLGKLAAIDIFLNNGDRVLAGNLGNWFTDVPHMRVATLIDNADQHTRGLFVDRDPEKQIGNDYALQPFTLESLAQQRMNTTALHIARGLLDGARRAGGFASAGARDAWAGAAYGQGHGGTNLEFMTDAIELGLGGGKSAIVHHLATHKMQPTGRAVKGTSGNFWDALKARARRLAKI